MNCQYDDIGNPVWYFNSTSSGNIYTFTWANGRQLVSGDRSGTGFTYTYNADGLRTKKVVDGVTTEYYWAGSQLAMMVVNPDLSTKKVLKFYYDAEGRPIYFDLNGTTYFYVTNLQGDVVALTDSYGEVVSYQYDAWGKPLATDYISSAVYDAMYYNPLRYRGYIYDSETEFYYLRSRYYDPVVGRFINADGVMGTKGDIATYNLYAYCGNSPVSRYDPNGMAWENDFLRNYLHAVIDEVEAQGYDLAEIGSTFLFMDNSKMRDGQKIYHSTFNCWQQWVGYNDFYDFAFDVGTSMDSEKFQFSYNGSNYVIWAWKGDYLNMGAGAEIGIYRQIGPAWYVDKDLAMRMWVFLDYNGENVISHAGGIHWWCAAFNPNCEKKDVSTLSATFRLRFSDSGMYYAFKNSSKTGKKGKWIYHDNYLVAYYLF